MKPLGTCFPQRLRSKVSLTSTSTTIPNTPALMAVQRHTAASRSAIPSMRVQQGFVGGLPMITLTSPSKLAQTSSFRVSIGQVSVVAVTRVEKRMLSARKRESAA